MVFIILLKCVGSTILLNKVVTWNNHMNGLITKVKVYVVV